MKLYEELLNTIGNHVEIPDFIPFVGSIDDHLLDWVMENPDDARELAAAVYRVLEKYLGDI